MMTQMKTRRQVLGSLGGVGAGLVILGEPRSARGAPVNEQVRVAIIGVGGRGSWFVERMPEHARVVALCDVDEERAGDAFSKIPGARKFEDFRRMLDVMQDDLDGVIVATPDHTHAVASALVMRHGKPVFCEKPLTHTMHEARALRSLAAESGVATQMGNQGTSSVAFRKGLELVQRGYIGEVREVHAWNNGGGRGNDTIPEGAEPVPDTLEWDLWLGPVAAREFHRDWFRWHQWRDFATGQLGNWAAHTLNLAFMSLRLDAMWHPGKTTAEFRPESRTIKVEAKVGEIVTRSFPRWERIRWDFPARGKLPPVSVHWHNGSNPLVGRSELEDLMGRKLDWGDAGAKTHQDYAGLLIIGSKGTIHANAHNVDLKILPDVYMKNLPDLEPVLPPSPGHEREWIQAIRGGVPAVSNFDYSGPLTEFILSGNIATQLDGELEFDPVDGSFPNNARADALRHFAYRKGWEL